MDFITITPIKKNIIILSVIVSLCLLLSGCGSVSESTSSAASKTSSVESGATNSGEVIQGYDLNSHYMKNDYSYVDLLDAITENDEYVFFGDYDGIYKINKSTKNISLVCEADSPVNLFVDKDTLYFFELNDALQASYIAGDGKNVRFYSVDLKAPDTKNEILIEGYSASDFYRYKIYACQDKLILFSDTEYGIIILDSSCNVIKKIQPVDYYEYENGKLFCYEYDAETDGYKVTILQLSDMTAKSLKIEEVGNGVLFSHRGELYYQEEEMGLYKITESKKECIFKYWGNNFVATGCNLIKTDSEFYLVYNYLYSLNIQDLVTAFKFNAETGEYDIYDNLTEPLSGYLYVNNNIMMFKK